MEEITDGVRIARKYVSVEDKIQPERGIGVIQNTGIPLLFFDVRNIALVNRIDDIYEGIHGCGNRTICYDCNLCLEVI